MKLVTVLLVLCSAAFAQTHIADTLYAGDGTTVNGSARIRPSSSFAIPGGGVVPASTTVPIVNGVLSVNLYPNPVPTNYQVEYNLIGAAGYTETWIVPTTSNTLKVGDVRQGVISYNITASQISPGTATVGQVLQFNGTIYVPATVSGGTGSPGGVNTQCQYNNSGSFGGITGCTTNGTSLTLVAPALGTPASGVLTNMTGLPLTGIVNINNNTILGNQSGGAGPPLALTVAQTKTLLGLAFSDLTGSATCGQLPPLTGDVTTSACAATIAAGAVSLAKMANLAANSFVGNNTGSPATPLALTVAQAKTLLALACADLSNSGTGCSAAAGITQLTGDVTAGAGSGSQAATIPAATITLPKMANLANGTLICRTTAGAGVPEACTTLPTAAVPAFTGDVTNSAGALSTTIAAGAVTLAKQANLAANSIIGNNTGAPATPIALTVAQTKTLLALACSDLSNAGAGCSAAAGITQLTGDVTAGSGSGSQAATVVNLPTGVTQAGYLAATAITAPATPAAGIGRIYVDSTSKNVSVKDDAGVVKHGVQTDTGTANNYISAISDSGAITKSRPACATLSDSAGGCTMSTTAGGDLSGTLPSPTVIKLNGTSLSGLATGLLKNTTATGVPSIAAAADVYGLWSSCTGSNFLRGDGVCANPSAGSVTLDGITAAANTNTIANGDFAQVWNWKLTTSGKSAFTIAEPTASTAAGTPYLVNIQTLSASTANPLVVTAVGTANGVQVLKTGFFTSKGTGGVDSNLLFCDVTDGTKCIKNVLSGITTGTTRNITWPDAAISVARTDAGQVFTGVQTMTSPALTTPAITGLATGSGVASAATASTLASRDANANLAANNFLGGYTTTTTAAGTTTLTVGSTYEQDFTGSTTQTVVMPVASTLVLGQSYFIVNASSGAVTVQSSGTNNIIVLAGGTSALLRCILTSGTTAASWGVGYGGTSITSGKLLSVSNTITLAGTDSTTWTGPGTSFSVARIDAAQTFTGIQTFNTAIAVGSGGTGTASTLTGVVRGGSPLTASEISGDCTTSGSNAIVCTKTNGVTLSTYATATGAVNAQTATYQVLAGDFSNNKSITVASGTFTITLVASGSQPANGQFIEVINYGSGVVTIARSGQNINGGTASYILQSGSATNPSVAYITSDGANYFIGGGFTNPMTTAGDLIYAGTTGLPTRLATGTANAPLLAGATPAYSTIVYPASAVSGGIAGFTSTTQMASSAAWAAGGIGYGLGAGSVPVATAAGTAKQIVLSGGSGAPTMIDFPERYMIPAANCNNTTAGAGWSIPSGGSVICRAGTNNLGGEIVITDTSSTFAQFQLSIPVDWDTATNPYILFAFESATDTTNGHTVIPQIKVSCPTATNGTVTDDHAFAAAHSSGTVTFGASAVAHGFYTSNVQLNGTDMTGCVAGGMMIVQIGRATDTATGNIGFQYADVTFPRLLALQAN